MQRRIRGRWFSLVPVKRRTAVFVSASMLAFGLCLTLAHYLAVSWPAIASHPEVARPLRLDRADSFGAWVTTMLLAASAGVTLLIYQLRRYRIDDYRGQYRIWRLVLIATALASVNSLTSAVDWGGAVLDVIFGKRVALSGTGWLRLLLTFGGGILAVRLITEVRQSRWSMTMMIVTWLLLAVPTAIGWNVISVKSLPMWTLQTASPLLSSITLFLSLGLYLRMLYREVRKIEDGMPLAERFARIRSRVFVRQRRDDIREESSEAENPKRKPKQKSVRATAALKPEPAKRTERRAEPTAKSDDDEAHDTEDESTAEPKEKNPSLWNRMRRKDKTVKSREQSDTDAEMDDAEFERQLESEEDEPTATVKKRWWNRKAKPATAEDDEQDDSADEALNDESDAQTEQKAQKPKPGWFGRRKAKSVNDDAEDFAPDQQAEVNQADDVNSGDDADGNPANDAAGEPKAKKKRGLGGWLKSKPAVTEEPADDSEEAPEPESRPTAPRQAAPKQSAAAQPAARQGNSGDQIDEDSIDWDSMSKSERRRMRKQLKRQGRAA